MDRIKIKVNSLKIKRYLRENLGTPFIIGFQVLLLVCAFLLVKGNSVMADEVVVYAYYLLVAGVLLQLICFYKDGEKEEQEEKK